MPHFSRSSIVMRFIGSRVLMLPAAAGLAAGHLELAATLVCMNSLTPESCGGAEDWLYV